MHICPQKYISCQNPDWLFGYVVLSLPLRRDLGKEWAACSSAGLLVFLLELEGQAGNAQVVLKRAHIPFSCRGGIRAPQEYCQQLAKAL